MMAISSSSASNVWRNSRPRIVMSISSFLQLALALLGILRKETTMFSGHIPQLLIWLIYVAADNFSYFSIVFPFIKETETDPKLVGLWASIFLLHCSGSETLTAYSLEDNTLWWHHAWFLPFKIGACIVVVLQCSLDGLYRLVVIPILICGIYSYCERVWVHNRASLSNLKDEVQKRQPPLPDYADIMERKRKSEKSGNLTTTMVWNINNNSRPALPLDPSSSLFSSNENVKIVKESHLRHELFKGLYLGKLYSYEDQKYSRSSFVRMKWDEAFQVVHNQESIMHDEIYTKALVTRTVWGLISRLALFLVILSSASIFTKLVRDENFPAADIIVTYQLLVFEGIVRLLTLLLTVFSQQAIAKESFPWKWMLKLALKLHPLKNPKLPMGQFDLLGFCLDDPWPKFLSFMDDFFPIDKCWHTKRVPITDETKTWLFQVLQEKSDNAGSLEDFHRLAASRGEWALKRGDCFNELGRSVSEKWELVECVYIWALATVFYHSWRVEQVEQVERPSEQLKQAKLLADYLLHLLRVKSRLLTSFGPDSMKTAADTIADLRRFLHNKRVKNRSGAWEHLLSQYTDVDPRKVVPQLRSVLWDACTLTKQLIELNSQDTEKELTLGRVLVELLSNVALQCRGEVHAELLSECRELVTSVWWITFQLGMAQHYKLAFDRAEVAVIDGCI